MINNFPHTNDYGIIFPLNIRKKLCIRNWGFQKSQRGVGTLERENGRSFVHYMSIFWNFLGGIMMLLKSLEGFRVVIRLLEGKILQRRRSLLRKEVILFNNYHMEVSQRAFRNTTIA